MSRHRGRIVCTLAALSLGVFATTSARAGVRTCVRVETATERAALQRLVELELGRHPSHELARASCEAVLEVELVQIGSERWLTARLDGEVPDREPVGGDGVGGALGRSLTRVLGNDPRVLPGPEGGGWLDRQLRAFRVHGRNGFGLELAQTGLFVGAEPQSLAGVGLVARREIAAFHVGVRVAAASTLGSGGPELHLTEQFLANLELAVFGSAEADTAAFGALVLGVDVQRFSGPALAVDGAPRDRALASGFAAGLRGGVELFRTSDVRYQLFAQVLLPTFVSRDRDAGVVSQWTPSASVGVGVWL